MSGEHLTHPNPSLPKRGARLLTPSLRKRRGGGIVSILKTIFSLI
jgi:hypothetical protein